MLLHSIHVLLHMFQKAIKTADDTSKQKSRTSSAKQQHQHIDKGAAGDSRQEKSFNISQSVFPPAPSSARHSSAAAGSAARDETRAVSCFRCLASYSAEHKNGSLVIASQHGAPVLLP